MYAYCTEAQIQDTDFKIPDDAHEIACWRKHPNLHGWMEELYRDKGGEEDVFNCATLRLLTEDLDELEKAVLAGELPYTTGFFFGESLTEDKELDLAFIAEARRRLEDGDSIFYYSWW
jgi:hypothetical protein